VAKIALRGDRPLPPMAAPMQLPYVVVFFTAVALFGYEIPDSKII